MIPASLVPQPLLAQPLWAYLHATPLSGLLATLVACLAGNEISRRLRHSAWAPPPIVAIVLLIAALLATHVSYAQYFAGAQYVHFLLGPATVALAVPMYANLSLIRRSARAVVPALLAGSAVSAGGAMLIARLMGAPPVVVLSLGPHSVTNPIAIGIAERTGGAPSLAASFVLITAMIAVPVMPRLFAWLRVRDHRAQGLAAGTISHGLATARMLLISHTAGAFAGVAIGLNGIVTAFLVPLLARLLGL